MAYTSWGPMTGMRGLKTAVLLQDESSAFQEMLGAVMDGATPLHCAALRTSPKLTEYLLASGADPMARTAAGDLPMDLVPPCTPKPISARAKGALCKSRSS